MATPPRVDEPGTSRRWRRPLAVLGLLLLLAWVYLFWYEPAYRGSLVTPSARPLVFAHRGFGVHAPDNSLYAVERALEAGLDGVDVDGQFTRDGEVVIFHDLSVDRLTSDTGRVSGKTLEQMVALDLGPKFDAAGPAAPVRPLEDFVRAVQGRGILMVELKVPGVAPTGMEERAAAIVRKYGAHQDVILSSFNPVVLYRLKRIDPGIRTALIFMDTNWNPELIAEIKEGDLVDLPWPLRQEFIRRAIRKIVGLDLLSINHEVDPAVTERLIAKGWPVLIWTPDSEEEIRRALARRPHGVISDQPIRARRLRDGAEPSERAHGTGADSAARAE